MSEDLNPCPFCGGEAELVRCEDDFEIECARCGITLSKWREYDNITDNCDLLIGTWNRRVNNEHNEL